MTQRCHTVYLILNRKLIQPQCCSDTINILYDFSNGGKMSSWAVLWSDQYLLESKSSTVNAVSGSQQLFK